MSYLLAYDLFCFNIRAQTHYKLYKLISLVKCKLNRQQRKTFSFSKLLSFFVRNCYVNQFFKYYLIKYNPTKYLYTYQWYIFLLFINY